MLWKDAHTLIKSVRQRAKGGKSISLSLLEEEALKHAILAFEHMEHHPWKPHFVHADGGLRE